jgi:ribosomal-protein-alanine N-acetyltransferase
MPAERARVRIRSPRADDEAEFLERVRASRRLHRRWIQLPEDPEDFAEYLGRADVPTNRLYVIVDAGDDRIVGIANLSQIVLAHFRSAYLGYAAFVPFEGRGCMTEGLRLVLREAFGPIGLHRVEANVQPDNVRSIALVERLGFVREGYSRRYLKIGGRWRDHVRYAILAEDFFTAETARRVHERPAKA